MGVIGDNGKVHHPDWLLPRFDSIPTDLMPLHQFLLWKAQWRDGRWTKVPYNSRGGSGSSTNTETWCGFDEAKAAYSRGGYTGIGIAMCAPLAGVDLDHCVDTYWRNSRVGKGDSSRLQ